ncbi:sigma-70 family RNA polymerase sigma factor [Paenibacillus sp. FSL R5-0876]|uniref:RNA polymerase sigma factor n=1 Tax=Paenibacillus TaxID=44249 RepID=UPI00096F653C|nr:sigma-70 family RNA polymerase sigma factor [Paenibacillus odorifer]OMD75150.1 RNA polymerase [Paenibacillus odorifer]OMD77028.1 RNA polymerase [Paenibacillus odorifer]
MHIDPIVVKAKAGDPEAFVQLMQEIELPLYRTARSIVNKEEDCADALQETMLKAFKNIHTLREPAFFKTWIFRILINECNKMLKNNSRALPYGELPEVPSTSKDYEKIELWDAVQHLEENLRIVIHLHYLQDMPIRQISDILEISTVAVKTRLHRARKKLKHSSQFNQEMELRHGKH